MQEPIPPIVASGTPTILALDPGLVTGLALIQPEVEPAPRLFTAELGVEEVIRTFQAIRDLVGRDHLEVVMEAFTISDRTMKTARSLDALDIIGYVKLSCLVLNIPFTLQQPAQAKKFSSDDKLKSMEWYERTKDGHKNDAVRHLLVYLINKHTDFAQEHIIPRLAKDLLK